MKIGILTVPFNNNYGGLLQAYALKTVLCDMGHDVVFLNRQRNKIQSLKFKLYRLLVRLNLIEDYLEKRTKRLSENTDKFKQKYLSPITEPFYTTQEFSIVKTLGIDCYIVGSDQVWRYDYAEDSIDDYFFNILDGDLAPRMSYAASFGTDMMEYPEEKQKKIIDLLKQFKGISVRETSGRTLLNQYFDVPLEDVSVVMDPTMLLDASRYKELFVEEKQNNDFLFTYILDNALVNEQAIYNICESLKYSRKDLKAQTGDVSKLNVIAPVEQWLRSIYSSKAVITDSFHGTVFSILFNRPFVVVANPNRGISRLKDLLSFFGLENHLVSKLDNDSIRIISQPVNWDGVNKIIKEKSTFSLSFLNSMLNV